MSTGVIDAATLRLAMIRFHEALQAHREEINSLNVYPVPDGDTGTNMALTQQAVAEELDALADCGLREVGAAVARASLMGARGNSGVILAQALRGLVRELASGDDADGAALARGLQRASAEAYRAVGNPVRGTVLDVLADAASASGEAAGGGSGVREVAEAALEAARDSLARTTDLLPELRRADVVDAGGRGVLLLFDALRSAVAGEAMVERVGPLGPVADRGLESDRPAATLRFRHEVQYLLDMPDDGVPGLRRDLSQIGDSIVVVGGEGTYKVHVHTNEPDGAVRLGEELGTTSSVSVTDLQVDVDACTVGPVRAVRAAEEEQATALVAVADGAGLERILFSLGAIVVQGGPGNNPSVGEILRAIEDAPSGAVIVLPDHENVAPAARQAADQSDKQVHVVSALSIPQGVAAGAAFNPESPADENLRAAEEAAASCAWGEVARAVRDADTPAGQVRAGESIGFAGGEAVAIAHDDAAAALEVVRRLRRPEHEILTLFSGRGVSEEDGASLAKRLAEEHPDIEIELHAGDQPGSPWLIGLE